MLSSDGAEVISLKFLCSYGGKILPRHPDGKLRYIGGVNRVFAVNRCITFAELLVKMSELCGMSVSLRCQFPMEDLDMLVSITSDEDLANLIEEYDRASKAKSTPLKIRTFLCPQKLIKKISHPAVRAVREVAVTTGQCVPQVQKQFNMPVYEYQPRYYGMSFPPKYPCHIHTGWQ